METTRRRVLRRKPLTDCSNVVRKSDKIRTGGGGFRVGEVSADEMKLESAVEVNGVVGYGKENDGVKEGAKGEESVGNGFCFGVDVELNSSLLSTPPGRKLKSMDASCSVSPITIYSRRKASKTSYGSSSCPPAGKKRGESSDENDQSTSKWHTEPSKKMRSLPKDLLTTQDFIKMQRAYFEEIDKFELAEEEVSETE